jgi:hypothetical protein
MVTGKKTDKDKDDSLVDVLRALRAQRKQHLMLQWPSLSPPRYADGRPRARRPANNLRIVFFSYLYNGQCLDCSHYVIPHFLFRVLILYPARFVLFSLRFFSLPCPFVVDIAEPFSICEWTDPFVSVFFVSVWLVPVVFP